MGDVPETEEERTHLLRTLVDELQLQAWLRDAEARNPSKNIDAIAPLAQLRDELRLQLHLGRLEARDEFERLEQTWREVKHRVSRMADEAEEELHDLLRTIHDGYRRLSG